MTEAFEGYRRYAGFSIRLFRGFDPESKGEIESVVKYVKRNSLPCQIYYGISELNSDGLTLLDRTANTKIHETTEEKAASSLQNIIWFWELVNLCGCQRTLSDIRRPATNSSEKMCWRN